MTNAAQIFKSMVIGKEDGWVADRFGMSWQLNRPQ